MDFPALLASATGRRRRILSGGATDACRLADGRGDGFPRGIEVDTFAGRLLLSTRDTEPPRDLLGALRATGAALYRKRLDRHRKEGSPEHLAGPRQDGRFLVRENGMRFEISFDAGYSQGLFLDQRDNRRRIRALARPGATVLNTFAYTGAFSVAAALGGATTTTLDLSQPYLDWARRNFSHNGLDPGAHYFCKGDTFHWLRRFARQGRRFDAVILDPPTFSRDDRGRAFRVESDYGELAALALACLAPGGTLLCCSNCRALSAAALERQIRGASSRPLKIESAPMPPDFTGDAYLKSLWAD
jgi:23S rRNA (cytosine1962-C5)-methyltransferase